jgi:hypothetical protein
MSRPHRWGAPMNRIKRIAAATAVSTVVLAPITAGLAFAEPYPGHEKTSSISTTKAQIEHEERLQMLDQPSNTADGESASSTGADTAGFPWDAVGLAALAGAAITAGGVAVVRRLNNEPSRA